MKTAGEFVNPIALLRGIDSAAADDAPFVADGGDFVANGFLCPAPTRAARWLDPACSARSASAPALRSPAALERPGAEVWILFGDGACAGPPRIDTFVPSRDRS